MSDWFNLEKGIRQGCPLSGLLFIITTVLFSCIVRQDPKIRGINIGKDKDGTVEVKLAQYADDTTAILADIDSGKRLLEMADIFTKISGLKLNKSKSYGMRLGAKTISCSITIVGITRTGTVKILGINFRANCSAAEVQENYELRLNNIEKAIAGWTRRNLSMIGKITVVKSLLTAHPYGNFGSREAHVCFNIRLTKSQHLANICTITRLKLAH